MPILRSQPRRIGLGLSNLRIFRQNRTFLLCLDSVRCPSQLPDRIDHDPAAAELSRAPCDDRALADTRQVHPTMKPGQVRWVGFGGDANRHRRRGISLNNQWDFEAVGIAPVGEVRFEAGVFCIAINLRDCLCFEAVALQEMQLGTPDQTASEVLLRGRKTHSQKAGVKYAKPASHGAVREATLAGNRLLVEHSSAPLRSDPQEVLELAEVANINQFANIAFEKAAGAGPGWKCGGRRGRRKTAQHFQLQRCAPFALRLRGQIKFKGFKGQIQSARAGKNQWPRRGQMSE
jgi:hypothetical protein